MLEFRILGPLEVLADGRPLALEAAKPRGLMAILLLHAGEVVAADRLIDELWDFAPPATAAKLVHGYVSRLRSVLPPSREEVLATQPGGYVLAVRPEQIDVTRFERLLAEGRDALAAGDAHDAAARLRDALGMWRGPPLADFRYATFAQAAIARLEELRLTALELRVDADLQLGRHSEVVGELENAVVRQPLRERPAEQLMLALYRSGRQADALEVYRRTRRRLADDLGLEPGPALRRLERAILAQDASLEPAAAPAAPVTRAPERRLITVLLAELATPSTDGDAETVHAVLDRAWHACAAVLERYGVAPEAFAGDAVVGCFGLERLREDDAERAVRAALEVRTALSAQPIAVRIVVESGEVLVDRSAPAGPLPAGHLVRDAARLAQLAADGEIRLGARARRLLEGVVDIEPLPGAWRLLGTRAEVTSTPFVGREEESARVESELEAARAARAARLVTVAGPAGIGKSRLVATVLDRSALKVLTGRCVELGSGPTYRPLAEMLGQLGADPSAQRLADAIARPDTPAKPEEIFSAVRRLFEALARHGPLAVVFEDAHWAQDTLLDLVEYLLAFTTAPVLLVCVTREELLEARPGLGVPDGKRSLLILGPLPADRARELLGAVAPGIDAGRVVRVVERADGNPLFLEQLAAAYSEGEVDELPATLHALLAARIDRLDADERLVLRRAAVIGHSFEVAAVAAIVPSALRTQVTTILVRLMRRRFTRPDDQASAREDAFRFAHVLLREAAYAGLPLEERADLHELVADSLSERSDGEDETVAHHLEQALRHRAALGDPGERAPTMAAEAARRLQSAARSALMRGDVPGAVGMLERAVKVEPHDRSRARLLLRLGTVLHEGGRLTESEHVLGDAAARARELDAPALAAAAAVEQQFVRLHATRGGLDVARSVAAHALLVLDPDGDELDRCRAWRLRAWIDWTEGRAADADAAWQRAAEHASRAGDSRERFDILGWQASAAVFGPLRAQAAIRRCAEIRDAVGGSAVAVADTLRPLALLQALIGDFSRARELTARATAILDDLHRLQSVVSHHEAQVELLAGDPVAAEACLRRGYERLADLGEQAVLATTAAMLAQAMLAQGRLVEALAFCDVSEHSADEDDLVTLVIARHVRAGVLVERGAVAEAEAVARDAVALASRTDALVEHGDAQLALAAVLDARGHREAAAHEAEKALELYERKGALVPAARARAWLQATTASGRR